MTADVRPFLDPTLMAEPKALVEAKVEGFNAGWDKGYRRGFAAGTAVGVAVMAGFYLLMILAEKVL